MSSGKIDGTAIAAVIAVVIAIKHDNNDNNNVGWLVDNVWLQEMYKTKNKQNRMEKM